VYSKEAPLQQFSENSIDETAEELSAAGRRRQTPASCAYVPSVAGLILAAEVIKDLLKQR